jgi:SWI/SNF-related matrix-associated actin-dependent regulator 1 of chromatin subfamily A
VDTQGLYPYQAEGVGFLCSRRRALLADDMGLGKTVQACQAMSQHEVTLVVCPKVMIGTWTDEINRWRPELSWRTGTPVGAWFKGDVHVVNYEQLHKLEGDPYDAIIADEAHYLKNPQADRTRRFKAIAKNADCIYGLTGTPLLNSPADLWGVLDALGIAKEAWGSEANYNKAFGRSSDRHGKTIWGKPSPAIAAGLSRVALRRTKAEVLPQLPSKRFRTIECDAVIPEPRGGGAPEGIESLTLEQLHAIEGDEHISTLRKLLAQYKLPQCVEVVKQYEQAGEPVVVMSAHVDPVKQLGLRNGWETICGDTPTEERSDAVARFQAGELRGLACTIQAAGVGITLTRSAHMVMLERAWNPSANWQAEDRICRIGQTRGCLYTFLVADHPLDRAVHRVLERKRVTIEESVDKMVRNDGLAKRLRELGDMATEATA